MEIRLTLLAVIGSLITPAFAATPNDGSVLPFPPTPSASKAGPTLQESTHQRRVEPTRLPKDAPSVLIVLIDDVGFGTPDTFGGFAHTPTLSKLRDEGTPGKHTVIVSTTLKAPKPGAPADIVLSVDGREVARTTVKMTVPAVFTASESFDVGVDLGSPVSRDYFDRRPFKFDGKIDKIAVQLK